MNSYEPNRQHDRPDLVVTEVPGLVPRCPYCEAELETVAARSVNAEGGPTVRFGKRYIYACPHCSKVLGISHRKGFWMG